MTNRSQHHYFSKINIFCNLLQNYKRSLHSESNSSSAVLYSDIWDTHREQLNKFDDYVMNTCVKLGDNNPSNNNWKSSLNHFTDPLTLFEQTVPHCINCKQYSSDIEYSITQFNSNDCKCDLGICNGPTVKPIKNSSGTSSKSFFVKNLDNNNSQDSFSLEDTKHIFKPIFGKQKVVKCTNHTAQFDTSGHMDIDKIEEENKAHNSNVAKITFKTAKETFLASNPAAKRTLGASRKAQGKFVSPMVGCSREKQEIVENQIVDERLKHLDPKMIELIESEIIDRGTPIEWEDIAGLQMAKSVIQEAVVWPLLRPDIFTGLRRPPKGILLFGPPGTGKTLIGKCIAAQCNATFFSISASSLTSKWIGDGEKMVRALFAVARCHQPAVIFIDEIDSLLTQRNDSEHEATRRIKTEFLVQFDGAATGDEDRLLIVGATNRPQELDEAARRRLVKRLYIPLPETQAREQIITNLLKTEDSDVSPQDIARIAALADGFSGADMKSLCSEAAMGPIRSVPLSQIVNIDRNKVRPVCVQDFLNALQRVRPSVSQDDLGQYIKWNKTYGQGF